MSADIVQLGEARAKKAAQIAADERLIWSCECGCTEFNIYADVGAVCIECLARQSNIDVTLRGKHND